MTSFFYQHFVYAAGGYFGEHALHVLMGTPSIFSVSLLKSRSRCPKGARGARSVKRRANGLASSSRYETCRATMT